MCQLISCCCDDDCCQCKIPKCSEIPKKRFFLPLIGVFAFLILNCYVNMLTVLITFIISFWGNILLLTKDFKAR